MHGAAVLASLKHSQPLSTITIDSRNTMLGMSEITEADLTCSLHQGPRPTSRSLFVVVVALLPKRAAIVDLRHAFEPWC